MSNYKGRLGIFIPGLYGGGAERAMLNLAQGMVLEGFNVDLILARAEGPYLTEVPKSVHLVDLGARRVLSSLPALIHYLRREQPIALLSILHANPIALWARRLTGIPKRVVVSERNTLSQVSQSATDLRVRLSPQLARRFYPWADGIVAVSKGVARDLVQTTGIPRERVDVIYNPIVTPLLRKKVKVPLAHPWFENGEPPVIMAVGRLSAQKDFSTLIQAFAQVRHIRPARLLILGEGETRAALEAQVNHLGLKRDVSLAGFVANPYPLMSRAAVFVLSSRWEGLPGVLIEALYCGAPIVATDCPSGPREILADGRYGLLVPVGDSTTLFQAIIRALNGEIPRSPRASLQPFELETVVDQYVKILLGP